MLTFRFTGASGEMTEEELLTAGMEDKQVRLEFSQEWDGLRKAVVFFAGSRSCTIVDAEETETIPAQMLAESLRRLYVGAYGLTEDGMVVIPAVYATGPFIHIGTDTSGDDSGYVPEDPFWLDVEENLSKTLRFTPQALSQEEKHQARQNIDALGENPEALELLTIVLKNGIYVTDQYENILRLTAAICGKVLYNVSSVLEWVSMDNENRLAAGGESYRAVLTPEEGYELDSVTVRMGGEDVTASVYNNGIIHIPAVNGELEILASAVEEHKLCIAAINKGSVSYLSNMGLQINAASVWRATVVPVGQYLKAGKSYRFGLGEYSSVYAYGLMVLTATGSGLSFPYVADSNVYYGTVTSRVLDSGWLQSEYSYTAQQDNLVLAVNFKRINGAELGQDDYDILIDNFIMEVVK